MELYGHRAYTVLIFTAFLVVNMIDVVGFNVLIRTIDYYGRSLLSLSVTVDLATMNLSRIEFSPSQTFSPIKKECKTAEKCSTSSNTQQLFGNTPSDNDPNAIKKPQAAAKQIFPHSNYSYSTNVAVVKGNPNKAPSLHNSNSNTAMALLNQQNMFQSTQQKAKQPTNKDSIQRIMNADEHEADEQKVVEGLKAIEKLRLSIKSDFIRR